MVGDLREGWPRPDYPDLANLMIALRVDPDLANTFAFDQMLQAPSCGHRFRRRRTARRLAAATRFPRPLRDADVSDLREYVQHYGFPRISRDISHEAADKRARELFFTRLTMARRPCLGRDAAPRRLAGALSRFGQQPRISQRHRPDVPDLDGGAHLRSRLQGRLHAGA